MHGVALRVRKNLHFDMTRIDDALLHEYVGTAEGFGRLGYYALIILLQLFGIVAATNTATASARCGLEHNGVADLLGHLEGLGNIH